LKLIVSSIAALPFVLSACGGGGQNTKSENGVSLTVERLGGDDRCWEVPFSVTNKSGDTRVITDDFILLFVIRSDNREEAFIPAFSCNKVAFSGIDPGQVSASGSVLLEDGQTLRGKARYERVQGSRPTKLQVMASKRGGADRLLLAAEFP